MNQSLSPALSSSSISSHSVDDEYRITDENDPTVNGLSTNVDSLYDGAPLSTEASYCTLLQYAVTNHLSFHALNQLIELVKIHCPQSNKCVPSEHALKKHFEMLQGSYEVSLFCSFCFDEISKDDKFCKKRRCQRRRSDVCQLVCLPIGIRIKQLCEGMLSNETVKMCLESNI